MATTLSTAGIAANRVIFSNGNNTIASGTTPNDSFVRTVATITAGDKKWLISKIDVKGANDEAEIGWANASASQASFLGVNTNSIGYNAGSGNVYFNNVAVLTFGTPALNEYMITCYDQANAKFWFAKITSAGVLGNWNNSGTANPATNTGGIAGPASVTTGALSIDAAGYQLTLISALANVPAGVTIPSGFSEMGATSNVFGAAGAATVAFGGQSFKSGVMSAAGTGAFTANGAATSVGALSVAGLGSFNSFGTGIITGVLGAAGVGAMAFDGGIAAIGSMHITGQGTFNAIGAATALASFHASGVGVLNLTGASLATGELDVAGVGAFHPGVGGTVFGSMSAAGSGTFNAIGTAVAIGELDANGLANFTINTNGSIAVTVMHAAGTSSMTLAGRKIVTGELDVAGNSAFNLAAKATLSGVLNAAGHGTFDARGSGGGAIAIGRMQSFGVGTFSIDGGALAIGVLMVSGVSSWNITNSSITVPIALIYPHPMFWDGPGDYEIGCADLGSIGDDFELWVAVIDSATFSRPTILAGNDNTATNMPSNAGGKIDVRIAREQKITKVPFDRNRVRAA